MRFSEAFRETVFRFEIKMVDLAKRSGLTQARLSDFKNGKNLRTDSVERILAAMPKEQREFMLHLVSLDEGEESV